MANDGIARKADALISEVGAEDARKVFGDILSRVGFGGERIAITRHGKPVAVLVSYDDYTRFIESAA
jgi:prevent-host-death family protein